MLPDRPSDPRLAPTRELPLVVHSAVRWNPAWHRPHQLLRAMAEAAPVLLLEEPVVLDDVRRERLDVSEVAPGVWRALPRLPAYLRDYDRAAATTRALLLSALAADPAQRRRFAHPVHWFSHAAPAREFAGALGEVGTVYDGLAPAAATPLAGGDGARERHVLARADLVLAGSDAAHAALAAQHPAVLRVEDGVDASRFALARDPVTRVPAEIAALPRPVLGYVGPVDDRLDVGVLAALCARVPQGSVVLVGPPGEGAPIALPAGVRWLGARQADELPAVLKGIDVAVFPLVPAHPAYAGGAALLLECLAAGRPVVATPAGDLARRHGSVVRIARGTEEFVAAALAAADRDADGRAAEAGIAHAERAAWPLVASHLRGVLFETIATRAVPLAPAGLASFTDLRERGELGPGL